MKDLINHSKRVGLKLKQGYDDLGRRAHIGLMMLMIPVLSLTSDLSHATPTIGDLGNNTGDQTTGLTSGALRIAAFVGICFMIVAFVKGRTAKSQGESIGGYITMGIIGALLFAIPTIISIVNVSLIGSDASQGLQGQIIQ
ncbi:DUF6750 family protein [Microbulbifer epialgicus]|uniref:DUF6750 family protein n=1 Tax=Microbulbifer epialgicus TaxID=393907 RepID=A0ABV4NTG5_9GAMM